MQLNRSSDDLENLVEVIRGAAQEEVHETPAPVESPSFGDLPVADTTRSSRILARAQRMIHGAEQARRSAEEAASLILDEISDEQLRNYIRTSTIADLASAFAILLESGMPDARAEALELRVDLNKHSFCWVLDGFRSPAFSVHGLMLQAVRESALLPPEVAEKLAALAVKAWYEGSLSLRNFTRTASGEETVFQWRLEGILEADSELSQEIETELEATAETLPVAVILDELELGLSVDPAAVPFDDIIANYARSRQIDPNRLANRVKVKLEQRRHAEDFMFREELARELGEG